MLRTLLLLLIIGISCPQAQGGEPELIMQAAKASISASFLCMAVKDQLRNNESNVFTTGFSVSPKPMKSLNSIESNSWSGGNIISSLESC